MDAEQLRARQVPLKQAYLQNPEQARVTLTAEGELGEGIACSIDTAHALLEAGLHPATGGDGSQVCSGDMLLQALAACAGVTLQAVATAFGIALREGKVIAEGDLDFRGTLGIDKECPVGFRDIRLRFVLDTDAEPAALDKLVSVTERYCVVLQTLCHSPELDVGWQAMNKA